MQLGSALRSVGDEADHGPVDLHGVQRVGDAEQVAQRRRLRRRIVGAEVQLDEPKLAPVLEELLEPFAWRMELEPVAGAGRDEGPAAAVLLYAEVAGSRGGEHIRELVVVEREAEVVHARQLPLARLDDDVHCASLELAQPQLEALALEVLPADAGLEGRDLVADAPVPGDQAEPELADVPRLDLPQPARDEVVVEETHAGERRRAGTGHVALNSQVPAVRSTGIHHVDLVVSSIERSLPFYTGLLGPLGYTRVGEVEGERGETIWYLSGPGTSVGLRQAQTESERHDRYAVGVHHVAFEADSRAVVDERAAWVVEQGLELESSPQEYAYVPGYYAVFFYDPDGIKLEIVHVPVLVAA